MKLEDITDSKPVAEMCIGSNPIIPTNNKQGR